MAAYPDDVQLLFKQFPLNIHKHARPAAIASLAAHRQGKFWEYHDVLFANYRALGDDQLLAYAKKLGLDTAKFKRDLSDPNLAKQIDDEMKQGRAAGVRGTPAFYVNGKRLKSRSLDGFKRQIDAALKNAKG
ncbi:MAG: hypothetical protein B7733_13960 [Myxococcales bacterium FL481]|nr:MAG: hypothetical protein B7733_13960 [Myxococcales bacterium FL481]